MNKRTYHIYHIKETHADNPEANRTITLDIDTIFSWPLGWLYMIACQADARGDFAHASVTIGLVHYELIQVQEENQPLNWSTAPTILNPGSKPLRLVLLRGLPGSGKTTLTRLFCSQDLDLVRVNRDDIRMMLFGPDYDYQSETLVRNIRNTIIRDAFREGKNVVVDDTNINPITLENLRNLGSNWGAQVILIDLNTSIETCIARDAARPKPVGEETIRSMAEELRMVKAQGK